MPVTLRGEVNNLTDKEYFSSYNFYGMPRTYAGSVEVRF
jgi:outer membrane receptor protein involved in Fe transport